MQLRHTLSLGLASSALIALPVFAQNTSADSTTLPTAPEWKFSFVAYLWVPAMDGSATVKGNTADVSTSVGDTFDAVFDNFKLGLSGHLEARRDRLALFGDFMYIALEDEELRHPDLGEGDFEFTEFFGELGAAYAIIDKPIAEDSTRRFRLEPLAGLRIYYFDADLSFDDAGLDFGGNQTWADVFGGLRATVDLTERLNVHARFDIGAGGSDFAWNALLGAEIKVGPRRRGSLIAGYRWLDVDYADGSGADRFKYDVLMHGPFVGFGLSF